MIVTPDPQTIWIDLTLIDIPLQARPHDAERLESLAQSMGKNKQLQNIVVIPKGERYEVIAGIGRTLAAKKLGWEKIRAVVREGLSQFQQLYVTAAENDEREDVNPFDRAALYKRMLAAGDLDGRGLAKALGKDETDVSRYLSLAELPDQVKESLARAKLSMSHLREILRLNASNDKIELGNACAKEDWPVKRLKSEVDELLKDGGGKKKANPNTAVADPLANAWSRLPGDLPAKLSVQYTGSNKWRLEVKAPQDGASQALAQTLEALLKALKE